MGNWIIFDDPLTENILEAKQLLKSTLNDDGSFELQLDDEIVTVTGKEEFWIKDEKWVQAKDLEAGDLLQTEDGDFVAVDGIEIRDGSYEVYNFEVEDFHTYFVSQSGVLVHNSNCERLFRSDGSAIPYGFDSAESYDTFTNKLTSNLPEGTEALFQGSSVTGKSYKTGELFDVGRKSDFDIALAGDELFNKAKQLGYKAKDGTRIGPLGDKQIERLGLSNIQKQLSKDAGRDVNFMLFDSSNSAYKRPSLLVY